MVVHGVLKFNTVFCRLLIFQSYLFLHFLQFKKYIKWLPIKINWKDIYDFVNECETKKNKFSLLQKCESLNDMRQFGLAWCFLKSMALRYHSFSRTRHDHQLWNMILPKCKIFARLHNFKFLIYFEWVAV